MEHSKKTVYMIGNSHIDPVWFWTWEEGMQEVKATYASVLARLREYPEFIFTATSTLFFEWIEGIDPEMFEEIRVRIREGRILITGGWLIEPDCLLPEGEAFVRQGLYGQRYLWDRFGLLCRIGANVDSFGHSGSLPQILKKSGMDAYVFMRPRLSTPVFTWRSKDGSSVKAICLPGEYTTWFHEPTAENIKTTLERTTAYDRMVCCYGVGNHGGGPTIDNIESIKRLEEAFDDTRLVFSSYQDFLRDTAHWELPVMTGNFEKINPGCYSIDSHFKSIHRLAQQRLLQADLFLSMARGICGEWMEETKELEQLWKAVLFNQFHDTLGGTVIKEARDEGLMQLSGACAGAGQIKALAIQKIVNTLDTAGNGFPLFLFHSGAKEFEGYVEVELNWFCKKPCKLLSPEGEEVAYQRVFTEAKTRNYNIGGRRRLVFRAVIPACGFAMYRVTEEEPSLCSEQTELQNVTPYLLENSYVRAEFDETTGALSALTDKLGGRQVLTDSAVFHLYQDERDAWGGMQERPFEDLRVNFVLDSIERVESGSVRDCIRVRLSFEQTRMEQLFILEAESRELTVKTKLLFAHPWSLLTYAFPMAEDAIVTEAESVYGTVIRHITDDAEYNMQRFLDVRDGEGAGLAIANNGKYSFRLTDGSVQVAVARSAIYAQGYNVNWYDETESYRYHDMREQDYTLVLRPHGEALSTECFYELAEKAAPELTYLADSIHTGVESIKRYGLAKTSCPGVRIVNIKKAQEDEEAVIRLLETNGMDTAFVMTAFGKEYPLFIGHDELKTVKLHCQKGTLKHVNLLEWEEGENI